MEISKNDWRLFREKLPAWQERYMATLNHAYMDILNGTGLASEKFWELEKRIRQDKRHSGVIATVDKRNMLNILLELRGDNVITDEELDAFSEELQRVIAAHCGEEM